MDSKTKQEDSITKRMQAQSASKEEKSSKTE